MRKSDDVRLRLWIARSSFLIPLAWLIGALVLGVLAPEIDQRAGLDTGIDEDAARDALTAIGTGMITFTGFVFSITLLILQFGSQSLSPRVVPELRRESYTGHALGVFIATFVFSLTAVLDVGNTNSQTVPTITVAMAFFLLVTSVVVFLILIQRMTTGLQIPVVLARLGMLGRRAVDEVYPHPYGRAHPTPRAAPAAESTAVLRHEGPPAIVATVDRRRLHELAEEHDLVVHIVPAIGERVSVDGPVMRIEAADPGRELPERALLRTVVFDGARTIDQDPAYALRLIVDIGIKALSAAINDPTTATQSLHEVEDLLRQLSGRALTHGTERVHIRTPRWADFVALGLDELSQYGAGSIQVSRRLRALLDDLEADVPPARRPPLVAQRDKLDRSVAAAFPAPALRAVAMAPDATGLGLSRDPAS